MVNISVAAGVAWEAGARLAEHFPPGASIILNSCVPVVTLEAKQGISLSPSPECVFPPTAIFPQADDPSSDGVRRLLWP